MDLKKRLQKRELTIGSWITIGNTVITEVMANAGYDWLTVDMEHSAITIENAQELIRVIELCGVVPLVRVGHNDPNLIKRIMDSGAHGVIVPMVNSRADAEKAVSSVKYPPAGFRGVGLARAQKYGMEFDRYKSWNQENSIVIVQIEHILAVENIEAILDVEGVDGFIIGPYDLSGSIGFPGNFDHPDVLAALSHVKKVAKEKNALSGFHVIPPEIDPCVQKIGEGYQFIAHSLDSLILGRQCEFLLQGVRAAI